MFLEETESSVRFIFKTPSRLYVWRVLCSVYIFYSEGNDDSFSFVLEETAANTKVLPYLSKEKRKSLESKY